MKPDALSNVWLCLFYV